MPVQPIACNLSPNRFDDRLELIAALARDALLDRRPIAGGVRSRFRHTPEVERRIRELVELESRCCAFLRFRIEHDEAAVVLDVTGPPGARPVIEQFFAAA